MNRKRLLLSAAVSLVSALSACGTDTSTTTASTASALTTAQCDYGSFTTASSACVTTYQTCIAATEADLAACRSALEACLPPAPDRDGHRAGDGGSCRGGGDMGPPPGDGGLPPEGGPGHRGPPPDADGGLPPPHDEDGGHGGHHQGRGPHPDPAAITACRDALDLCLTATPADTTCIDTEAACVKAAFDAAFQAACDEATVRCANDTTEPCVSILARCAAGVSGTNASCSAQ